MKTMRISDEFLNQIKKSIVLPLQLDNSHYNRGVFIIGDYRDRILVCVAVSRAAKQCVVIAEREWREDGGLSSKNAYDIAIEKYVSSHRVTGLTERIKQAVKE